MFLRLKAPVWVIPLGANWAAPLTADILLNVNRIGYVFFSETTEAVKCSQSPDPPLHILRELPPGTRTMEMSIEGDIRTALLRGSDGAMHRFKILFPEDQRHEFERIRMAIENRVIDE